MILSCTWELPFSVIYFVHGLWTDANVNLNVILTV